MPPKGWRKDAQGNYPTTSYIKEQENITIQDLLFPKSTIVNLAREVPQQSGKKLLINKDASLALQRGATVFVNHLLLFAREIAKSQDKKSCSVDDVLSALDHIGHSALKGPVRDKLDEYQAAVEQRKKEKLDSGEVDADGDIDMGEDKENAPVEKVKEHDEIEEQGDALQDVEESSEK
ncbi:AIC_G0009830.mRNA.1.CDS.1 [Saccharomyces cerevisiae]|nr:AIC_G0009830.mRNA.1.CDS.1 [Saccharomyces cerevisiae]CAI4336219.1 AFI_G0009770.mRNA.1.CDS.1 [Saccharomyces cerevisiae]CAI6557787.1 AFI_G0009770.mRNA.1.CDS.1 [Saccharomyces cerevisiae]CAI6558140.1 AIC_G0009830.mRNA.1.CDS.1 [Saccharomyces cerevisiae]CAY78626.1 Dpb4p [Saccharomyces cerevisiae EC1118]